MTDRHPIYSGQATGQPIGYIEDDQAFDLFDRPWATYEGNTGLLRDPKKKAVVGYVSLSDIFVGSSWMAQELFSKTGPITPQASLEDGVEERAPHATDITTFPSSSEQDKVAGTALLTQTGPHFRDASATEQSALPQDASAGKSASDEPASDYASGAVGETGSAPQRDDDGSVPMPASSSEPQ